MVFLKIMCRGKMKRRGIRKKRVVNVGRYEANSWVEVGVRERRGTR